VMTISEMVGILGSMCKTGERGCSQKVNPQVLGTKEIADILSPKSIPLLHRDQQTFSALPFLQFQLRRPVSSPIPIWEICRYAINQTPSPVKLRTKSHTKRPRVQREPKYSALAMPLRLRSTQHHPLRRLIPRLTLRYHLKQPLHLHSPSEV